MASFTERNLVPRAPSGPAITDGARKALLAWFVNHGLTLDQIWGFVITNELYGTWDEMYDDMRSRFDPAEADVFKQAMDEHFRRQNKQRVSQPTLNAEPALLSIPAPLFLDALEHASKAIGMFGITPFDTVNEINRVFTKIGANYQFNYNGQAEWHGDAGTYETVIHRVLDASTDPRLTGVASEYHAALSHLRNGTEKDRGGRRRGVRQGGRIGDEGVAYGAWGDARRQGDGVPAL